MAFCILIVDDIEQNRRMMRLIVNKHLPDAELMEASNGKEALEQVLRAQPHITVLDVVLPDMDGFEVCRRIKAQDRSRRSLVLMVSGRLVDARHRIIGLDSGADSYLCKPFQSEEFASHLLALCRISRAESDLVAERERMLQELDRRAKHEMELERAKSAAEAADRAKSAFLAHMSHEIRTPMNAVIGLTEILRSTPLSAEQLDYVQTIQTAGETLLMVINDVLDHSKIESGKLEFEDRPFRLDDLIRDAVNMIKKQVSATPIRLSVEFAPGMPLCVRGDPVRLRQILSNLLSNAVKFTDEGEIAVLASAVPREDSMCDYCIAVRDTGIGMSSDKMSRLFQPFSQLDASMTRRYGGTGLGLSISRRLAQLMQGDIQAESREGHGSTFHVRVRLTGQADERTETTEHMDEYLISKKVADPAVSDEPNRSREDKALRILVAEDNPVNRKVARSMLRVLGYRCDFAEDGCVAVTMATQRRYDLILMDVQMPNMAGVEAMQTIRAACGAACPRIVAVTAHAMAGDREKYMAAGMDDYVSKPIRESELARVLAGCEQRQTVSGKDKE